MKRTRPSGRRYSSADMEALRQARGGICEYHLCFETAHLEFAHDKPTKLSGRGRGLTWRYLDIKKHPSHYKLYCRQHHRLTDLQHSIRRTAQRRRRVSDDRTGGGPQQ